jgi:DNA-binding NarL/FixJ family response regulator
MDLTVPGGLGGKEAVRKLLEIDPGVKAIVSSGYSNDPVMSDPAAYGFGGVVVKPYNAEELGKALYKILRQDSQRAASSA